VLTGYTPGTTVLGMQNYNGIQAPGFNFIAGMQDPNFPLKAFNQGWLTRDSLLNTPFMMNTSDRFNLRATLEPLRGLKIDLTANRNFAKNHTEFFIADEFGNLPPEDERGKRINGNFSMSYLSWGTAFERIYNKDLDFSSDAFAKFKDDYRQKVSRRLAAEYTKETGIPLSDSAGYWEGFGPNSQQVMVSAFLAAYGHKDPEKVSLKTFPSIWEIMPNWRITYDGLSRIEALQKYVTSITMNHAYRSSYNIGQYISYPIEEIGLFDNQYNFIPQYDASSVSISEQFSPLFDLNTNWRNSLSTRIEFNRSRTLSLSTANSQVNEMSSKEIVFGAGYRFNEVQIIVNQREFNSDLNVRADLSIRDNRTVIRKLAEDSDQITAGQRIITMKTTLDYVLSDRFTLQFFFDRRLNKPFISLAYPTANTNIGFSIRFSLVQ
jgi:cell surface protein SprA